MRPLSDHTGMFQVLRKHPILKKMEQHLSPSRTTQEMFKSCLGFMYPKTLLFAPNGIAENIKYLDVLPFHEPDDETDLGNDIIADRYRKLPSSDLPTLTGFVKHLVDILENIKFSPIFVLDVRTVRVLDISFVLFFVKLLQGSNIRPLVLLPSGSKNHLNSNDLKASFLFFDSAKSLKEEICSYLEQPENTLDIGLKETITLKTFERFFENLDISGKLHDKLVVNLDFTLTTNISFHAMCLLSPLCHSISHRYGVLWKFHLEGNKKLNENFSQYKIYDINRFILYGNHTAVVTGSACGLLVFDETQQSVVTKAFDHYMGNLCATFNYLKALVSVIYDEKYSSRKAHPRYAPVYSFITNLVYELVDNVTLHSEGLGYFGASVIKDNILCIFIGDTGVGLKRGILKNYDLSDKLMSSEDAIKICFNLRDFSQNRKRSYAFNSGSEGFGLGETLSNIFTCKGKLLFRTGKAMGAFVNPVSKLSNAKVFESKMQIDGTQYMILIPLTDAASSSLPRGTDDFLAMEA